MGYEESFGQWMVARRRALRLQRTELASQVGCAAITLRKIETDERRPSLQLARILAVRLGLTPPNDAVFVRVARGELPADHLPTLPLADASTLPGSPPAPSAVGRVPTRAPLRTNLPAPLTSFVGRSQELATIPALIESQRLVTLTGVGGVGKTRLAIEVGIGLVRGGHPLAPDGIWIVELAALAQPALVAQAIAQVFHLPEQSGRTALDLLQEHLADQQLLLVLDNCEHLIEACAEVAEQLLQRCWQLRILATSREPLRVQGERTYSVTPLTLPGPSERQLDRVRDTTAGQLFLARMDATVEPDAAAIAQICRQLDGIPLALELAAPLSHSMPLAEIATQLQHQMAVLTNAYRTAIPRHQTMHSAMVWSYRLLAPEEQQLLAGVAVFAGGWTVEAAQAVCDEIPAARVQPMLAQLVTKSLVLEDGQGQQRRYRMLEPVRQFAQAQLAASGMDEQARRSHAAYFLSLAEQMHRARDTSHEREWLNRLEPERDNLRAVNIWAIEHGEAELAHRFNGWLFAFWIYRAAASETRRWIDAVLALKAPLPTPEALVAEALALDIAGYFAVAHRDYAYTEDCFQRELNLYAQIGHKPGIATGYRGLGFTALHRGDLERSEAMTVRSLEVSQSVGDRWGAAWSLFDLGYLALVRGDLQQARVRIEAALPEFLQQDIMFGALRAMIAHGHVMRELGDRELAAQSYTDALRLQQRMQYVQPIWDALDGMAGLTVDRQPQRAAILFGASQVHSQKVLMMRWPHLDEIYARDLALARRQLSEDQWEAAWEQGYAMSLDEAVAYALGELG